MQIIRPDMWPLIAGFVILILFFVGLIGLFLLNSAWKNRKQNNWNSLSVGKLVLGLLMIGFVIYNWIGYYPIFSENEKLIIGEYDSGIARLTINSDYTWKITGDDVILCKNGKWEYVMSEDWCYWNIESENLRCKTQIGQPKEGIGPKTIVFTEQTLKFNRIK